MSTEGVNRYELCVGHFVKHNKITMCQTFDLDISPLSESAKQTRLCDRPRGEGLLRHLVNCSKMLTQSKLEASLPLSRKPPVHAVEKMGQLYTHG